MRSQTAPGSILFQLLSGQPPDGEERNTAQMIEGSTSEEQVVCSCFS